jgi:hypothetical protein
MVHVAFSSLVSDPESDGQFQLSLESHGDLDGLYDFEDHYCSDPHCDCQVVILVVKDQNRYGHAIICYGWQPRDFYLPKEGVPNLQDELMADWIATGYLDPSYLSEDASFFLSCFIDYFRDDELFKNWLKRRYRLFKEALAKKTQNQTETTVVPFHKKASKQHKPLKRAF